MSLSTIPSKFMGLFRKDPSKPTPKADSSDPQSPEQDLEAAATSVRRAVGINPTADKLRLLLSIALIGSSVIFLAVVSFKASSFRTLERVVTVITSLFSGGLGLAFLLRPEFFPHYTKYKTYELLPGQELADLLKKRQTEALQSFNNSFAKKNPDHLPPDSPALAHSSFSF